MIKFFRRKSIQNQSFVSICCLLFSLSFRKWHMTNPWLASQPQHSYNKRKAIQLHTFRYIQRCHGVTFVCATDKYWVKDSVWVRIEALLNKQPINVCARESNAPYKRVRHLKIIWRTHIRIPFIRNGKPSKMSKRTSV